MKLAQNTGGEMEGRRKHLLNVSGFRGRGRGVGGERTSTLEAFAQGALLVL